jgi:hypothetical protein
VAILTTFKVSGDPDELFAIAREKVGPVAREVGAANGRLSSTIIRDAGGLIFVNIWENEEGMRRTAEQIGPVARQSGMPAQEDWQMYEVLHHDAG